MCAKLQIIYVKLNQSKLIEEHDSQMILKFITYVIYSTLTVKGYKELTASMFIMCLKHQGSILESSWITYHSVWSDLINYSIVFISHFCDHFKADYLQI